MRKCCVRTSIFETDIATVDITCHASSYSCNIFRHHIAKRTLHDNCCSNLCLYVHNVFNTNVRIDTRKARLPTKLQLYAIADDYYQTMYELSHVEMLFQRATSFHYRQCESCTKYAFCQLATLSSHQIIISFN